MPPRIANHGIPKLIELLEAVRQCEARHYKCAGCECRLECRSLGYDPKRLEDIYTEQYRKKMEE